MVPDGWREVWMQDVVEIPRDRMRTTELEAYEKVQLYSFPAFDEGKEAKAVEGRSIGSTKYRVPEEAVLFSKLNPHIPRIWHVKRSNTQPSVSSTEFWPLVPRDDGPRLNLAFLSYALSSRRFLDHPLIQPASSTNSHRRIRRSAFNRYPLLLPPLPEQKRIAAILTSVDDAIAATRNVMEQTKRVKNGLLQDLMTRGIGHARFKTTEIGQIPEEWKVVRLGEIADLQTGPFGSQLKASQYTQTGIPVVMPSNLSRGRIEEHDIARVPQSVAEGLSKHRVEPGDILFARRGEIGRCAVVQLEQAGWLCGTGCLRARPQDSIDSGFLFLASSRHPSSQWLEANALGQTMLNLNTALLRKCC